MAPAFDVAAYEPMPNTRVGKRAKCAYTQLDAFCTRQLDEQMFLETNFQATNSTERSSYCTRKKGFHCSPGKLVVRIILLVTGHIARLGATRCLTTKWPRGKVF